MPNTCMEVTIMWYRTMLMTVLLYFSTLTQSTMYECDILLVLLHFIFMYFKSINYFHLLSEKLTLQPSDSHDGL